ncbi:hypothetical protein OPV22_027052 [Ensete ventricosum]|uniref:DUF7722 domain-containing protein n=1 Tax=Ensete ventricosum TaxID=4639 RepID=A0A426X5A4_ENSVE|nr:hypothetical protein OPV22_027052 [Ensete ventricosum]RRT34648.1 hypothetical protein B296_00044006 [Ensete ventricosum]RWW79885.1 hypothetical protein BHE74_00011804 [Ensete ventricosum]RZR90960.1 hypothetical protein BHM03_00018981 [Ensete ventricosum]
MGSISQPVANLSIAASAQGKQLPRDLHGSSCFRMPLHYPRYTRADYESMPEWKLDCLLREYGLPVTGDVDYKRSFAMGAFLWPAH